MGFWLTLLIYVGLQIAYDLLKPKPHFDSPEPSSLGDFRFPTIGEGRAIPIVWGTCKLSGPMVTWYGDLEAEAMKEEYQTGLFTSEEVITHYRYYLGMQLVLCSGEIDEVLQIRFDNKQPVHRSDEFGWDLFEQSIEYTPGEHSTTASIDACQLFGGEDQEGGVKGQVEIYHGTAGQTADSYLVDQIGSALPAYRHICYAVFKHVYLGTSPYIKDISFVVRRCPNSLALQDGDHDIDGDANPAAMIYELLTRPPGQNGLGIPVGMIDLDGFREVGATLAAEELGLSMQVDQTSSAKDLILEICRHIDAVVYQEPSTGFLTIKLIRFDYEEEGLPVLDESNCTVTSFSRSSWDETKNQVRVSFLDRGTLLLPDEVGVSRAGFEERSIQVQDLAAIEARGGQVSTLNLNLRGFSNPTNAQRAGARALKTVCYPVASMEISSNRSCWAFRPGTVFKLNWPPLGIEGLVCRVTKVALGELRDGEIVLEAMEDVFAVDWVAYTPPGDSDWDDPAVVLPALTDQAAMLAPYEATKNLPTPEGGAQQAVVAAARGTAGLSKGFNAVIEETATRFAWFTPSGTLESEITESSTSIVVDAESDALRIASVNDPDHDAGANIAWLVDDSGLEEFIAFKTVAIVGNEITLSVLARGCLDTAPTAFSADTRIWFLSYGNGVVNINGSGMTEITFQPFNNLGGYDIDECPSEQVTAISPPRRDRVYCPTDVKFNGMSYPSSISGELTVSWEHRNRLGAWGYADSGKTDTPETDTEYDVLVYGESDTLVHTEEGVTGKSWTYLEADEIAESGLGRLNNHLRVILRTYGDGRNHQAIREIEWEMDRV